MEISELDENDNCITDLSADPDYSNLRGVVGDPEILPRVGNQYQVDIPALIEGADYIPYMKSLDDAGTMDQASQFQLGLPIPVMLIDNKDIVRMKEKTMELSSDSTDAFNKNATFDSESFRETMALFTVSDLSLVPGSSGDLWSDLEKASLLLGLYIFEKNFAQLKRFVESKKMEDIQAFYYGEFYRSNEYKRWSTCPKRRSRKRVFGQRIFSGLRQQELLSRLVPQVSKECQEALLEISKTFGEGKICLEEYVSSVKGLVGMNILVEAIAIGKGNLDLTCMVIEPVKSNLVTHMQRLPIGKACSSLTPTEIIKCLTGGYRLSKSQSTDIFWESVWPCLLARGWHSEQPKDQAYVLGAKHDLVFLMPGIKKFSKSKLEKGKHYFDSISDVLSKVSSEPRILKLDTEEDEGKKEENERANEGNEEEDLSKRQRHCYLQPRCTPSRSTNVVKFTVVDTSMTNGKLFKFRELKTLPTEILKQISLSEESDQDASDLSTNESETACTMLVDQEVTNYTRQTQTLSDRGMVFDRKDHDVSSPDQGVQINGSDSPKPAEDDDLDSLALVTNRKGTLAACSNEETSSIISTVPFVPRFDEEVLGFCTDSLDQNDTTLSLVGSSQDRLSSGSSKGSPPESVVDTPDDGYHGPENPQDNLEPRILIDLNLPQYPVDFESDVYMADSTNKHDDMITEQHDNLGGPKTSEDMTTTEQQMNSRRHSTRNRPPTARALEALANGYLTTNRRRKKELDAHNAFPSRRARRDHVDVRPSQVATNDAVLARPSEGVSSGGNDMFDLQIMSNGTGTWISNPSTGNRKSD